MIKAEQIPPEVVAELLHQLGFDRSFSQTFRKALAATLAAWPHAQRVSEFFTSDGDYYEPSLILPLPQEGGE